MTLSAGTRLGPYEILALLGSGGMGEVYRARDTRLNRDVAIKILPSQFADNPTRRARFLREAQAISQLSHPNICAIYDVGEHDSTVFLVMEFIDGESLEQRLRLGPVAWRTALPWAIQIASAIEAAHRHGIVHRDLKPANVMLAESGVKLLDFGIAHLLEGFGGGDSAGAPAPTVSLTAEQTVVGTLQYMSPEQLEERSVDARTDVFSLGATLYEMLTGRKAFEGASPASLTAAILTADPPPVSATASADPVTPAALDHVIRRALAKDPDERWQTARDVMLELRWILEGREPAVLPRSRTRVRAALTAAGIAVVALAAAAGWWLGVGQRKPAAERPVEFTIAAPGGARLSIGYGLLAVSRDGRKVAFVAGAEDGPGLIWWQSLDSADQHALPGTDNATGLFWSPDGMSIGFYRARDGQFQCVGLDGGPVTTIAAVEKPGSPSAYWSEDGTITFADRPDRGGLHRVKVTGGEAVKLNAVGTMPRELPGGRFLYHMGLVGVDAAIKVAGAGIEAPVTLPIESNAAYASGYLVFRQSQTLVAQTFDPRALRFTGPPTPLAEDVMFNPGNGRTAFDVSDTLLVYRAEPPRQLYWRDRFGQSRGAFGEVSRDWNPVIAPDGSLRVAVDRHEVGGRRMHVWVIDGQGRSTQVSRGLRERFPAWSPDGLWLAYLSLGADRLQLVRTRAVGAAGEEVMLSAGRQRLVPLHYTRDALVYEHGEPRDLFTLPLNNGDPIKDAVPRNLTNTPSVDESTARVSPNGRWLAFMSNEGGDRNIWIEDFPAGTNKRQITTTGGRYPQWRQDGGELYYLARGSVMAVPVSGTEPAFGRPVELFKTDSGDESISLQTFAASPDGQRFLVREKTGAPDVITVVVNWASRIR
jgi:Tol biopolymer transport system component